MSAFAKGEVKVTMNNGKVYEGTYFCQDPVTNTLVIQNKGGKGYMMLFDGHVKSIEGDIPESLSDIVPNLEYMCVDLLRFCLCFMIMLFSVTFSHTSIHISIKFNMHTNGTTKFTGLKIWTRRKGLP